MATVTMPQTTYPSTSSSSSSGYSESDLTTNFGRIKFSDGPTLIVCDIDNENPASGGNSVTARRPHEGTGNNSMTMTPPGTAPVRLESMNGSGNNNIPVNLSFASTGQPSMMTAKQSIERSPSTSSLSVPSVDVDEKRPPLPGEESMMILDGSSH